MTERSLKLVEVTAADILRRVASATFRPFNRHDWMAFAGCDSPNPQIGSVLEDNFTIIIDGPVVAVYDNEYIGDGAGCVSICLTDVKVEFP